MLTVKKLKYILFEKIIGGKCPPPLATALDNSFLFFVYKVTFSNSVQR